MEDLGRVDAEEVAVRGLPYLGLAEHLLGDDRNLLGEVLQAANVVRRHAMPVVEVAVEGDSRVDVLQLLLDSFEDQTPPFVGRHGLPFLVPIGMELGHRRFRRASDEGRRRQHLARPVA